MKNTFSASDMHNIARDDLQRMAREDLGRSLSSQELHAVQESLRQGTHATEALDSLVEHLQRSLMS